MPLKVVCQGCGFTASVPDHFAGKQGKCPKCGTLNRVPLLNEGDAASEPPAAESPQAKAARLGSRIEEPAESENRDDLDFVSGRTGPSQQHKRPAGRASARQPAAKPSLASVPAWAWTAGTIGAGLIVVLVVALIVMMNQSPETASNTSGKQQTGGPPNAGAANSDKKPDPPKTPEEIYQQAESAVVRLDVNSENEGGLGTGFLIDPSGIVATNYHVTRHGTRATAKFKSGESCEVEGYLAVKPAWDVVLIKLKTVPKGAHVLPLLPDLKPATRMHVIAIGCPKGYEFAPSHGEVTNFVRGGNLTMETQSFLRYCDGETDQQWIEHNADIFPGNSGGPLITDQGEALGMNTWVSTEATKKAYAISAWYIREAMKSKFPQPKPLADFAQKKAPAAGQAGVTVDSFQKQFDELVASSWSIKTQEDYWMLQDMVQLMLDARAGNKNKPAAKIAPALEKAMTKLGEFAWNSDKHVLPIDKRAALAIGNRQGAGLFAFAEVLDASGLGGGGAVLKVLGTDHLITARLAKGAKAPASGAECLLFAIDKGTSANVSTPAGLATLHYADSAWLLPMKRESISGKPPASQPDPAKPTPPAVKS